MRLKEFIFEARRNPELNPRQYTIDVLEKLYKQVKDSGDYISEDIPNLFVSFTNIEKLGIHPKAPFTLSHLPIGVYAYPVKAIIDINHIYSFFSYASTRPFVNIFQLTGNVLNLKTVTYQQQKMYIDQIRDILNKSNQFNDNYSQEDLNNLQWSNTEEWWHLVNKLAFDYFSTLWHAHRQVAANKLHRILGIDAVLDPGLHLITNDIESQTIIFNIRSIKNIQRMPNLYLKQPFTDNKAKLMIALIREISNDYLQDLNDLEDLSRGQRKWVKIIVDFLRTEELNPQQLNIKSPKSIIISLNRSIRSILDEANVDISLFDINRIRNAITIAGNEAMEELGYRESM